MIEEPYLILHRVRSEDVYDIAQKIPCPICEPVRQGLDGGSYCDCNACNGDTYWWIIPTSGHRAYPWWFTRIEGLMADAGYIVDEPRPIDWPDHYTALKAPYKPEPFGSSLAQRLGLVPKTPVINRRI